MGDFDRNGRADLVWRNTSTGENTLWLLSGTSFTGVSLPAVGPEWTLAGSTGVENWTSGAYRYDGAGNVSAIGPKQYLYDQVGRLVDGPAEYTRGSIHKKQTYTYDSYGNLETIATVVNGSTTNTVTLSPSPATNRLTSGASYDEAGNQTAWGAWSYTWDGLNMMRTHYNGSKTLRFFYTADDERIATYDAVLGRWTWRIRGLDQKTLSEYRNQGGTWSWQKDWIYRGGALLGTDEPTIGVRHFALDHLGTPRLITNATRTAVAAHTYYPFGQEATSETQDAEVMKFTGHERDTDFSNSANAIDYMHARYYVPVLGRFLSVDPLLDLERSLRAPQNWTRYSYTANNPVTRFDRDGRAWETVLDVIAVGYGVYNLISKPSWSNAGSLAMDVGFAAVPFIPNVAALRHLDRMKATLKVTRAGSRIESAATKLHNIFKYNLDQPTITAAAREAAGQVVAVKPSGVPYDHFLKYQEARAGAADSLEQLQKLLGDERLSDSERAYAEYLLKTYSTSLDDAERLYEHTLQSLQHIPK